MRGKKGLIEKEKMMERNFLIFNSVDFSEEEIFSLLIGCVTEKNSKNISKKLLHKYGSFYNVLKQDKLELEKNKFITKKMSIFLRTLFIIIEKQLYKNLYKEKIKISNNTQLLNYLKYTMLKNNIEVFKILFLNVQNELLKDEILFKGTLDKSTVYIREIVKKILEYNAKSIIIVHNHPGGSLVPSLDDIQITQKIKDTLENMEINVLDHIIVSERGHFSFLEENIL